MASHHSAIRTQPVPPTASTGRSRLNGPPTKLGIPESDQKRIALCPGGRVDTALFIPAAPPMNYRTYIPHPPLTEFVAWFWYYDGLVPDHSKERVLPHGALELIIDLKAEPKRLFDREDYGRSRSFRRCWMSGAQSRY